MNGVTLGLGNLGIIFMIAVTTAFLEMSIEQTAMFNGYVPTSRQRRLMKISMRVVLYWLVFILLR